MNVLFGPFTLVIFSAVAVGAHAQAQVNPAIAAPSPTAQATALSSLQVPLSMESSNPFDAQRKVWPDRVPPPPPPARPPPPTPVTDQDMQLYGVVIVGAVKRATVKVGSRFASLAVDGKAFATLTEGQSAGEFTVSQIQPTHIVLNAPGGLQSIYFTKKTDRSAGPGGVTAPAPVQAATAHTPTTPDMPTQTASEGGTGAAPTATATAQTPTASSSSQSPGSMQMNAPDANAVAGTTSAQNPMAGGLAAALAAARAKAVGQAPTGQPSPIFGNPFHQKP